LEAQEIGRSKNVFVSTISHELRSPLGMVSTCCMLSFEIC
jgi:signal transduction histidine kinase